MWSALLLLTLGAVPDDLASAVATLKETMRAELRSEMRAEVDLLCRETMRAEVRREMRAEMDLLANKLRGELQGELVKTGTNTVATAHTELQLGLDGARRNLSPRRLEDVSSEVITDLETLGNKVVEIEAKLIDRGLINDEDAEDFLIGHRLSRTEQKLDALLGEQDEILLPMDAAWVLSCATLVFLMQLGFAQLESGMCRPKNVIATYMKNIIDFVLGTFCTLLIGYSIAYPQTPLMEPIEAWKFFFHLVFQATASTIVSGAMAERTDIRAYMLLTTVISGFIFSVSVRWTWGGGWIAQLEPSFHDFAGSGVVHLLGGSAALAGGYVIGPRIGRWENPSEFVPHSVPQVLSGVLLLWVGWYGFNPGSTGTMSSASDAIAASNAAMSTTICAATAGLTIMIRQLWVSNWHHMDVMEFANALLAGLVAATAGCDVFSPWSSIVVGAGAAYVYTQANMLVYRYQIDDVVDAAAVHGASGAWGCIAVGLFHPTQGMITVGITEGEFVYALLRTQFIGIIALACLGAIPLYFMCQVLAKFNILRTSIEEEEMGIDMYIFKMQAYTYVNDTKSSSKPGYLSLSDKDAHVVESAPTKTFSA